MNWCRMHIRLPKLQHTSHQPRESLSSACDWGQKLPALQFDPGVLVNWSSILQFSKLMMEIQWKQRIFKRKKLLYSGRKVQSILLWIDVVYFKVRDDSWLRASRIFLTFLKMKDFCYNCEWCILMRMSIQQYIFSFCLISMFEKSKQQLSPQFSSNPNFFVLISKKTNEQIRIRFKSK